MADAPAVKLATTTLSIVCPYCGEAGEVIVDPSVDDQEYIEDCWVCCRPIVMHVTVADDEIAINVRAEDE